jgi:hypothetical protein
LYPAYELDESISLVYWNERNINSYNSIIKGVKENYPNIKIVNEDNIFPALLEVLTSNE